MRGRLLKYKPYQQRRQSIHSGTKFYVPTAYTPNGNGAINIIKAIIQIIYLVEYFTIYNRWERLYLQAIKQVIAEMRK